MKYGLDDLRAMAPLYVQGKLQKTERKIFENGLKQYPQLKEDLAVYQSIGSYYKEIETKAIPPSKKIFPLVEHHLEEQTIESELDSKTVADRFKIWFSNLITIPQVGWGVAAVQCAIILLLIIPGQREARYETLSAPDAVSERASIQLVFNETIEEKEIRKILHSIKGNIVSGPSSEGMYHVSLPDESNIEETIKELKSEKGIVFAEKTL